MIDVTTDPAARYSAPSPRPGGRALLRMWAGPAALVVIGAGGVIGSLQLGLGTGSAPGPGMWPAIASGVILVSGIVMGPQEDTEGISRSEAFRTVAALVLLGLFITMFSLTGIFFPTLIVLTLWLRFLAGRKWLKSIIISAVTAGVFYLIFALFFGVGS